MLAEWAQYKADAAEAKLQQQRAHEAQVRNFCHSVSQLSRRLDAFELWHADRVRRDAEAKRQAERRAISDYLKSLPDADDPASYEGSPLTTHGTSAPEDEQQLRAITAGDTDSQGDLPEDILERAPEDSGNYDFTAHPAPQVEQPISVSLNEA
jgi:hypothetical protein